ERRDLTLATSEEERQLLARCAGSSDQALALGVRAELPDWAVEILRGRIGENEILAIGRGMQTPAPLDLRINPLRASRDEVLADLQASGIEAASTPYSPV